MSLHGHKFARNGSYTNCFVSVEFSVVTEDNPPQVSFQAWTVNLKKHQEKCCSIFQFEHCSFTYCESHDDYGCYTVTDGPTSCQNNSRDKDCYMDASQKHI